jgi:hypothetical protein
MSPSRRTLAAANAAQAGIELNFAEAQRKQMNQITAIHSFIARKVEGKKINLLCAHHDDMAIGALEQKVAGRRSGLSSGWRSP